MSLRIANAPCSWGVLEFDTPTQIDAETFLTELVQSGFRATELGDPGFLPQDPADLRELLARHSVELVGGFVPVALSEPETHADGLDYALDVARQLAAVGSDAVLVLADDNGADPRRTHRAGRITPEDELAPIRWRYLVHAASEIARVVREETGIRTVFHHHCAGWIETAAEVRRLMERTPPDLLGLCFDTGHWAFAGGDPVEGLTEHRDRIWHVHFKDCDTQVRDRVIAEELDYFQAVKHGIFCELGTGCVDFSGVARTLQDWSGTVVVEQDVLPGMGSPLDSAIRNRRFLETLAID